MDEFLEVERLLLMEFASKNTITNNGGHVKKSISNKTKLKWVASVEL